jgi:hypothetical protein
MRFASRASVSISKRLTNSFKESLTSGPVSRCQIIRSLQSVLKSKPGLPQPVRRNFHGTPLLFLARIR